ncbi:MAG: hypothetical protein OXN97_06565 [Bryobacterales bacterium]|nr:hypothetical protein [Bryobacterales bacterium]MDE0629515.1 hypothetical protein [Bryobacterales bacterium]
MDTLQRFRRAVIRALGDRSAITVAEHAGLPRLAIRQALEGHEPRLRRAFAIARAVGLDLRIVECEPSEASGDGACQGRRDLERRIERARCHLRESAVKLDRARDALREPTDAS